MQENTKAKDSQDTPDKDKEGEVFPDIKLTLKPQKLREWFLCKDRHTTEQKSNFRNPYMSLDT